MTARRKSEPVRWWIIAESPRGFWRGRAVSTLGDIEPDVRTDTGDLQMVHKQIATSRYWMLPKYYRHAPSESDSGDAA